METKDENIKITVLGNSHSGKTCYLLAAYNKMLQGIDGYTLTSLDDFHNGDLIELYRNMRNYSLGEKRFPKPTQSSENDGDSGYKKYTFDLSQNYEKILSFEWIDYAGGDLQNSKGDYRKIFDDIQKSSCLIIFVDGEDLIRDSQMKDELETEEDKVESLKQANGYINRILIDYAKRSKQNKKKFFPPIAIVVTKYDLYKKNNIFGDSINDPILCRIIEKVFDSLFGRGSGNELERLVSIIPISLGTNISDNDYKGKLKPVNLNLPILFGVYFSIIKSKFPNYEDEIFRIKEEFKTLESDKKNATNEEIERLKTESENAISQYKDIQAKEISELEDKFEEDTSKLEDDKRNKIKEAEEYCYNEIEKVKKDRDSTVSKLEKDRENKLFDLKAAKERKLHELNCELINLRHPDWEEQVASGFIWAKKGLANIFGQGHKIKEKTLDEQRREKENEKEDTENEFDLKIKNSETIAEIRIGDKKREAENKIDQKKSEAKNKIAEANENYEKERYNTERRFYRNLEETKNSYSKAIDDLEISTRNDIRELEKNTEREIEEKRKETDEEKKSIQEKIDELHLYIDDLVPTLKKINRWYRFDPTEKIIKKDNGDKKDIYSFEKVMSKYVFVKNETESE